MKKIRAKRALALAMWGLASSSFAQPLPVGVEEQVHQTVGEISARTALGMNAEGRSVVVYAAYSQTAKRLRAKVTHPGLATAPTSAFDLQPIIGNVGGIDVAMGKYGQFLAAWETQPNPGTSAGIRGQLVSWLGEPMGSTVILSDSPVRAGTGPVVATAGYGSRYSLVWEEADSVSQNSRLFARMLDSNGLPSGEPIRVDEVGEDYAPPVDVAMNENGESLIAFGGPQFGQPSHLSYIQVRVLGQDGTLGDLIAVAGSHTQPDGALAYVDYPGITALIDGGFAVAWRESVSRVNGQNSSRVMARVFNADRTARGEAFEVASTAVGAPLQVQSVTIAADHLGRATIAWLESPIAGGASRVLARQVDLNDTALGDAFLVAGNGSDAHYFPAVASDADGDLLVGWTRVNTSYEYSSMVRRFRGTQAVDLALSTDVSETLIRPGELVWLAWGAENRSLPEDYDQYPLFSATGVKVDVRLPSGSAIESIDPSGWTCGAGSQFTCALNDLLPAATQAQFYGMQLSLPSQPGLYPVSLSMTANQADESLGNDEATLTIRVADLDPDAINFVSVDEVARGVWVESASVVTNGYDLPVSVSITNGEYRLNDGAWTSTEGSVAPGSQLQVRHLSAASFSTLTTTEVSVGGTTSLFTSTTLARDVSPEPFTFADVNAVAPATTVTSDEIRVVGLNDAAPITVQGGRYSVNGGAFTDLAGSVVSGDRVRLQHVSAQELAATMETVVTIGDFSASFRSTTENPDASPDSFVFADVVNARRGRLVESETLQIVGINVPVTAAITGGEFSINGGGFSSASRSIRSGDTVQLRTVASSTKYGTVSVTITIGSLSDTWKVVSGKSG